MRCRSSSAPVRISKRGQSSEPSLPHHSPLVRVTRGDHRVHSRLDQWSRTGLWCVSTGGNWLVNTQLEGDKEYPLV